MAGHSLKILRCSDRRIFKVWLSIFQHYEWKGYTSKTNINKKALSKYLILLRCRNCFLLLTDNTQAAKLTYLSSLSIFMNIIHITLIFSTFALTKISILKTIAKEHLYRIIFWKHLWWINKQLLEVFFRTRRF